MTFTGIDGTNTQGRARQEGMGRIVDSSRDHLGPAGRAVITALRLLAQAAQTVYTGATRLVPAPVTTHIRAVEMIIPKEYSGREVLMPELYPDQHQPVGAR